MTGTNIRDRAIRGVLWTLAQKWATRVASFLTFVLLARLLDPHDFGIVALAAVFIGVLTPLSNNGSANYLVQASEIDQRTISTAFWSVMALSLTLCGALALSAPLWAMLLDAPKLAPVLQVMSLALLLNGLSSTQASLLKRRLQFKTLAVRSIAAVLVSSVVALVIALSGGGVWSLVGQSVAIAATSAVVLWSSARWTPSWTFDWKICVTVFKYGSQVALSSIVTGLRTHGDSLIIGVALGPVALGYWSVARRVLALVVDTGIAVVSTVAMPVFAKLKDDPRRLRTAYVRAVSTSLTIMAPVLLTLSIVSPALIPLMFGARWEVSGDIARIVTLTGIAMVSFFFDRALLQALNRPGTELVINLGSTVFGVALLVALSPLGLTAVAVGFVVRAFVTWPWRLRYASRLMDLDLRDFLRQIGAVLVSAIVSAVPAAVLFAILHGEAPAIVTVALVAVVVLATMMLMTRWLSRELWTELRRVVMVMYRTGPVTRQPQVR